MRFFDILTTVAFTAISFGASSAAAVEITGGDVDLHYSAFSDNSDFSSRAIEASLEVGFSRSIGMQFDLATYAFGNSDQNVLTGTVHGLYHINDKASAGVFYGVETWDTADVNVYGIEFGYDAERTDFEGCVGKVDDATSATIFGAKVQQKVSDSFFVEVSYDAIDAEVAGTLGDTVLKVGYDVTA